MRRGTQVFAALLALGIAAGACTELVDAPTGPETETAFARGGKGVGGGTGGGQTDAPKGKENAPGQSGRGGGGGGGGGGTALITLMFKRDFNSDRESTHIIRFPEPSGGCPNVEDNGSDVVYTLSNDGFCASDAVPVELQSLEFTVPSTFNFEVLMNSPKRDFKGADSNSLNLASVGVSNNGGSVTCTNARAVITEGEYDGFVKVTCSPALVAADGDNFVVNSYLVP